MKLQKKNKQRISRKSKKRIKKMKLILDRIIIKYGKENPFIKLG